MKNLFNFFFSFDKLLKEKLIIPFFWLAIVSWGLTFFSTALDSIHLAPIAALVNFIGFFVTILLALVSIRLVSELAVALFRINDNLSPDGGKSESADIDIVAETRKAAEEAAARAKELGKSASEKTKSSFESAKDSVEDVSDKAQAKVKSATKSTKETVKKAPLKKTAVKKASSKTSVAKKPATKKASVKKTTTAPKTTAPKKRGPKSGTKAPRDADGNLLKKDGTPRKRPGPKT